MTSNNDPTTQNEFLDDLVSIDDQIWEVLTNPDPVVRRGSYFSQLSDKRKELSDGEVVCCHLCKIGQRWNYQTLEMLEVEGVTLCPGCFDAVLVYGLRTTLREEAHSLAIRSGLMCDYCGTDDDVCTGSSDKEDDDTCDCCGGPLTE